MANQVIHWRTKKLNDELLRVNPEICIERARLVTQSYKETESEPMVIRRAKALEKVLSHMTIFIQKDQLIAGTQASKLRAAPVFPETEATYLVEECDMFEKRQQDRLILLPQDKQELLEEILPYWQDKNMKLYCLNAFPDDIKRMVTLPEQIFSVDIHMTGSIGHIVPNFEKILKKGISGIKEEIQGYLKALDLTLPESYDKDILWRSQLIICDAVTHWIGRYADKAKALALKEQDSRWKAELLQIAETCEKIASKQPENFREAVQLFWFIHLLMYIEQNGLACSVGRFDQFMYPYYKMSVEKGDMSREEMQELIECLWIKFTEVMRAYDYECAKYYAGFSISENLCLGGTDETGNDVTNELSYMCLDAEDHTKLPQPNLAVRVHNNSPEDFLMRAVEVSSTGRSKPEFFNDNIGIFSLMKDGVTLNDARNYAISGCVEAVPADCDGMTNVAMTNVAKALELALNDGKCRFTREVIGVKTGDPRNFKSIEDVISAYKLQVEAYVKEMVKAINIIEHQHMLHYPLPYFSLIMSGCMESGVEFTKGGCKYNFCGPQAVGLADVANSLAAIQKLIFEDQMIDWDTLLEALEVDFEDYEPLRQTLLNKAPKWGNDDDYVDRFAGIAAKIYCDAVAQYKNARGGPYRPGIYSTSANVPLGLHVGALPNGRKARQPIADGVGTSRGTDFKGPTAVVCSVSKLDHSIITNGSILNQKFTPKLLEDAAGKRGMYELIRTYFDRGGWHIQFNVVSADTLKKAQAAPQQYKDLIIRVAGYSAFFTELDKAVQDDIILRTEQTHF